MMFKTPLTIYANGWKAALLVAVDSVADLIAASRAIFGDNGEMSRNHSRLNSTVRAF